MGNDFKVISGKLVGRSHGDKIPCQDSVVAKSENGVTVVVLSDGCGSAILSHHGSQLTVNSVAKFLCEKFDALYKLDEANISLYLLKVIIKSHLDYFTEHREELIEEAVRLSEATENDPAKVHTLEKLNAKEERELIKLFYSTVCFIAVKDNLVLAGQQGDGRVGTVIDNKLSILLEERKDGAVNQTEYPYNIFSKYMRDGNIEVCRNFRIVKMEDINLQAAFAVSDGCDPLIEYVDAAQGTFFRVRFNSFTVHMLYEAYSAENEEDAQEKVNARLEKIKAAQTDDCSVGIMVRELPESPNDLEREILERPRPQLDEEELALLEASKKREETKKEEVPEQVAPKEEEYDINMEEEEEEEEEEIYDPRDEYASSNPEIEKLFDDVINFSDDDEFNDWIYDSIDSIQERCFADDSLKFDELVNLYHEVLLTALKDGEYRHSIKDSDIPELYFEVLKDADHVLTWKTEEDEIIASKKKEDK